MNASDKIVSVMKQIVIYMTEDEENKVYEKGFMLIPEESLGPCHNCGEGTIMKYCKKYNGYVGKCTSCGINWRES